MEKHRLYWWWRVMVRPESGWNANDSLGILWRSEFKWRWERSAFLHELSARIGRKPKGWKPWLKLKEAEREAIAEKWPCENRQLRGGTFASSESSPPPGYTAYVGKIAFNLHHPNETLARMFVRWLESERKRTGIVVRSNSGQKRRPVSWRPIELLDIQRLKLRVLTDSERSQVSKAKKQFQRVFNSRNS